MEKQIFIKELFPMTDFLSSRESALHIRNLAFTELQSAERVNLNFEGFDTITQSFTDELIGVVVRQHGVSFLKNKFHVSNAGKDIRAMLNFVVSYSISSPVA